MKTRKNLFIFMFMFILPGINLTAVAQTDLSGDQAQNGTFYLMNVNSGMYLKFGGAYNAKAAEGNAGTPITLTRSGNGYTLKTNAGYLDSDLMMTGTAFEWTLTQVDGVNQYYLKTSNGRGVLTSKGNAYGLLGLASYNPDDNKQKWILLTIDNITEMLNVTPLIQAASFDKNDDISAWGINAGNIVVSDEGGNAENHHLMVTGKGTFTQDLGNCASGTYVLTFDAYYRRTSTNGNVTAPEVSVKIHKTSTEVTISEGDTWVKNSITLNNNGNKGMSITITSNNNIELHVDNFVLKHIDGHNQGSEEVEQEDYTQLINRLNTHIEDTQEQVDALNEAGQAAYDISAVIADRDAGNITSEETLQAAIETINAAYETALEAHNQKELEDLIGSGGTEGGEGGEEGEVEVDVTDLFIKNAGFGTGDDRYWTINGTIASTSGIAVSGATGSYLFRGSSIRQDVALTNGKYKLTAKVASTNGATVTLTANEDRLTEQSTTLQTTTAMTEITLDKVIAYDGQLLIQATGDVEFYLDDFSLSYQEALPDDPQLQETGNLEAAVDFYPTITVTRTLKANTWNTFVVPFNMPIPENWEVKELASSTINGESITLTFNDAASIEAGVPYMVRLAEATSTVTVTNVWLDTELKTVSTEHVEFIGTYTNSYVPDGSFFISGNKFYLAVGNGNKLKGYRAYFTPTVSGNARSLGYRFGSGDETEEGTTVIDNEPLTNDNEPTVVAIYTPGGVRISDMQQGVNILQMSDGTTIKVVIK